MPRVLERETAANEHITALIHGVMAARTLGSVDVSCVTQTTTELQSSPFKIDILKRNNHCACPWFHESTLSTSVSEVIRSRMERSITPILASALIHTS